MECEVWSVERGQDTKARASKKEGENRCEVGNQSGFTSG